MKNIGSTMILMAAFFMLFATGKMAFFIPLMIAYAAVRANESSKKRANRTPNQPRGTSGRYDPNRRQREAEARRRRAAEAQRRNRPAPPPRPRNRPQAKARPKNNPFKTSGVAKYKDFDYEGAIEDFKKALEIDNRDIPTHFNLACAYSLTEQKDLSYKHIDAAVQLGFKDFEKIKTHDAFAFIRIQNDFEAFEKNGFRITAKMDIPQKGAERSSGEQVDPLLLERLKKLAELRDRGILTEAEFLVQKEKLLK